MEQLLCLKAKLKHLMQEESRALPFVNDGLICLVWANQSVHKGPGNLKGSDCLLLMTKEELELCNYCSLERWVGAGKAASCSIKT